LASRSWLKRSAWLDYVIIAAVAILLALLVQAFLIKPYRIPSPSMERTLLVGDRVLVNRLVYHFRGVHRGDIVVFKWPVDTHVVFIKRVIGLPGDVLSLRAGHVFVNGVQQNERYLRTSSGQSSPTVPGAPLSGSTMSQPWTLQMPYTVPAGDYFVMGDNRGASDDSRIWGPVPKRDIIGRAFFIYWPLDRLRIF
jgi:signal peptidase I